jgi:uncharacterized delta-60 repeat protein
MGIHGVRHGRPDARAHSMFGSASRLRQFCKFGSLPRKLKMEFKTQETKRRIPMKRTLLRCADRRWPFLFLFFLLASCGDSPGDHDFAYGDPESSKMAPGPAIGAEPDGDGACSPAVALAQSCGFNDSVFTSAVDGDKIYVGGNFTSYQGKPTPGLLRFKVDSATGALKRDPSFRLTESFNSAVYKIALAADGSGKIFVAGFFTLYGTTPAPHFARLNADGSLDTTFTRNLGAGFDSLAITVAVATDAQNLGKVYVGGYFNRFDGNGSRKKLVRLNQDGTLDGTFDASPAMTPVSGLDASVSTIKPQTDGRLYVGGSGFGVNNSATNGGVVRLNSNGATDPGFNTGALGAGVYLGNVYDILVLPNGSVILAGEIFSKNNPGLLGITPMGLIKLGENGAVDTTFDSVSLGVVGGGQVTPLSLTLAPDNSGRIYAGGFINVGNGPNSLVRLSPNGVLDRDFRVPLDDGIYSIGKLSNSHLYVAGSFSTVNGAVAKKLGVLSLEGALVYTP